MSKLHNLAELGQSIWLDYIRRDMLDSGELNQLKVSGVRGVTSNPSIFEKAIAGSDDYDAALRRLAAEGLPPMAIYEALAIEDIQRACDVFQSLFHQTDGGDGYVSLECDPNLAYDTEGTIEEARRLFKAVDRPNVYIKVPATPEGIPAIRQLISEGININVTLIFAVSVYETVAEAYLGGLEDLAENGGDLSNVSSVASFFVSRMDTKVDKALDTLGNRELRGKIGIANAKMAYQRFKEIFSGPRWEQLEERGARLQRPLWGSTSTKDPAYPDTMYVDHLIGPHTVNTVPPDTLDAFLDHGTVARTVDQNVEEARQQLQQLSALGISLDEVTDDLLEEGVDKFVAPFQSLIETIDRRRSKILAEGVRRDRWEAALGPHEAEVRKAVEQLEDDDVLQRIWDKDHTLWADDPEEISNRLGWLNSASVAAEKLDDLQELARTLSEDGYTDAVLLGMGGSSLAPELFARTFGPASGHLTLSVLDSTDPGAVNEHRVRLNPATTVFIVSSKSGTTVETLSFFKYFYSWIRESLGEDKAGQHFIAITDPRSHLEEQADRYNFRATFLNDPDIGGRYAALSYVGLVPAALLGLDLQKLIEHASQIAGPDDAQLAAYLGAVIATMAKAGRDKLTFILSPELASFGDWVEQLIAESLGKDGKGILPIVGEPPVAPGAYADDRAFIHMSLAGGAGYGQEVAELIEAGFPVLTFRLQDPYELGQQFLLWEIAVAVAAHLMGVHPFNQPNVEAAKRRAAEMLADFSETGSVPEHAPALKSHGITVHEMRAPANTPAEALDTFLEYAREGSYIAVHAYVQPTEANDAALAAFRAYLRQKTALAVTVGYGPRFLHSTGQLHKGDAGRGLFIQLVSEPLQDTIIPDEPDASKGSLSFGTLKLAQALGDARALREAGRHVIRFKLHGDVPSLLANLQSGNF
ncbi:MAG TPA: bifunctional transaldolase/phosoglucose isomerase [Candidatus Sulfomarinibacteraceae bacterium]|nr:bifunctional transaldolase/phosoglucose isomerase [Candidatus Sulfomarinibacteraceae bacterium]